METALNARRGPQAPPGHINPATPAWYEWYLQHDHERFSGSASFLQTGLKLAHTPFIQLDYEIVIVVEEQLQLLNRESSVRRLRLGPLRYSKLVNELFERWRPRIDATVPGMLRLIKKVDFYES